MAIISYQITSLILHKLAKSFVIQLTFLNVSNENVQIQIFRSHIVTINYQKTNYVEISTKFGGHLTSYRADKKNI